MFVNDRQEYIGTSECRLSSEPCERPLISRERSGSVYVVKPCHIRSRVSRIHESLLCLNDTHDSCSARYTFILWIIVFVIQSFMCTGFVEAKTEKKYDLVICAIFKDEELFLKEWIEYHKLVGVQHFYLYDNGSSDSSLEILKPYIKAKEVDLISWKRQSSNQQEYNFNIQIPAYEHALKIAKKKAKWAAFIDLDEFICPVKNKNLVELLKDYTQYGGLAINWQLYGTSNRQSLEEGELLTEALVYKMPTDHQNHHVVKCIVQPSRVESITDPHSFSIVLVIALSILIEALKQGYLCHPSIALDVIRINHYWYGTENWFFNNKLPRRAQWGLTFSQEQWRGVMAEANSQRDEAILGFVPALRKKMFHSKKK